jgi:hypothetical protein
VCNEKLLNIEANTLNGVYEGINISNFKISNVSTLAFNNNITLMADPIALSTVPITHFGIRTSNNGFSHGISTNTVRGNASTNALANTKVINFEMTSNVNSTVVCNRSTIGYTAFKFLDYSAGPNPDKNWVRNITDDAKSAHHWILHIQNSRLGDQGSSTASNDNRFGLLGTSIGAGQTMVTTIPACSSRIWVRSNSTSLPFKPQINVGVFPVWYNLTNCTGTSTDALPLISNPPSLIACQPNPPQMPLFPSSSGIALMNNVATTQV